MAKGGNVNFNPDGNIKSKVVHASGDVGGMLVGNRHNEGGIKAINKSTGQPLEMEGGEVVITRDAVSDNKKRSFNGQMMTNREILSTINKSGGGVSFADGGELPNDLTFDSDALFEYGGETMCGCDMAKRMAKGGSMSQGAKNHNGHWLYKGKHIYKRKGYGVGASTTWNIWNDEYAMDEYAIGFNTKKEAMLYIDEYVKDFAKGGAVDSSDEMDVLADAMTLEDGGSIVDDSEFFINAKKELGKEYLSNIDKFNKGGQLSTTEFPIVLSEAKIGKYLGGSTGATLYKYNNNFFVVKAGASEGQSFEEFTANQIYYLLDIDVPRSTFIEGNVVKEYIEQESFDGYDDSSVYMKNIVKGFVADALLGNWDIYKNDNIIIQKGTDKPFRIDSGGSLRYRAKGEKKRKFQIGKEVKELESLIEQNPKLKPYVTNEVIKKGIEKILKEKENILDEVKQDAELRKILNDRIDYLEDYLGSGKLDEQTKKEFEVKEFEVKAPSFEETFLENKISDLRKLYNIKKVYLSEISKGISLRNIRKYENALDEIRISNRSMEDLLNDFVNSTTVEFGDIDAKREVRKEKSLNKEESELTTKEYRAVRSNGFNNWFGDWELAFETNNYEGVSKVINSETKEPLVVYHGTDTKFTSWETYQKNNLHYFAKKKSFADWFAKSWKIRTDGAGVDSGQIKSENPIKGTFVYSCFLDIKNPIDFTPFGVDKVPFTDYLKYLEVKYDLDLSKIDGYNEIKNRTEKVYSWVVIRHWQQFNLFIKNNTPYDGFSFYEFKPDSKKIGLEDASLSFTAFNSNQIKFTNNTSFNKFADDSRLEVGGIIF